MDLDKKIRKISKLLSNTKPDKCKGCKFIHQDKYARSCELMDGGFDSVIEYELANNMVAYDCPLIEKDSEEYKQLSELLAIYKELKEARAKLKAIEEVNKEAGNDKDY